MADYAPPIGPPPPHVPPGWKAVWNAQYKEYFYVNIHTKESTWEKPTQPAEPSGDAPASGAPPAYDYNNSKPTTEKPLGSNNPYGGSGESDEALARRLQAEENQRAQGHSPQPPGSRGQADGYYNSAPSQQSYGQQSYGQGSSSQPTPPEQKKGLFSKLTGGKLGGSSSRPPQGYGQNYGPPPGQYGGYQQHYPPQGYPPQAYGGGYAQQPMYAQQPARKTGGMGALGGGALGLGAGLLGGALIGEAIEHHEDQQYGDDGGYGGDDGGYGGGDGGGDFGGGDGGGDF